MTRRDRLISALQAQFAPTKLDVADDSHRHAGHAGVQGQGGETHYRVSIVAKAFNGLSRVERHRLVQRCCAPEFSTGLHALQIDASGIE